MSMNEASISLQVATRSPQITHLEMPINRNVSVSFSDAASGWDEGLTMWRDAFKILAPQLLHLELPPGTEATDPIGKLLKSCTSLKRLKIGYGEIDIMQGLLDNLPPPTIQSLYLEGFLEEWFAVTENGNRLQSTAFSELKQIQFFAWTGQTLQDAEAGRQFNRVCQERGIEVVIRYSSIGFYWWLKPLNRDNLRRQYLVV